MAKNSRKAIRSNVQLKINNMCLYPKFIFNKKYTNTKKNGGIIPPISDIRTLYIPVGCQKCIECRKQKAREWQVRLLEDIKHNKNGKFITLTFSNESIAKISKEIPINIEGYTRDNAIAKWAVRHWLERWRKEHKKSIRHWLITELGHKGTENVHLHGIIWTNNNLKEIEDTWQYGFMWKGKEKRGKGGLIEYTNYVNEKTVNYITKYVTKIDNLHTYYKPIVLTSPGIGALYTEGLNAIKNKYNGEETNELYRTRTGHKIGLPVYWRNKIYTEEEKEKLWIIKLNKEERWVRGEKYDVSKGINEYVKAVNWHRQINKELGYGDGMIDYDIKQYEEQLRTLKLLQRINGPWITYNKLLNERL